MEGVVTVSSMHVRLLNLTNSNTMQLYTCTCKHLAGSVPRFQLEIGIENPKAPPRASPTGRGRIDHHIYASTNYPDQVSFEYFL